MLSGWVTHRFRAMGSPCHLVAGDVPEGVDRWALDEMVRLEQSWSRFLATSELQRVNRSPDLRVAVPPTLRTALVKAVELWWSTDGWFDPTVLDALEAWGYDRTFERVRAGPPAAAPDLPVPSRGCRGVRFEGSSVTRPPGLRFDLGGIGKGLAADLVAEGMVERGARAVILSVGGDVRAAGTPPRPWPVPVEHPVSGASLGPIELTDGALVMSTTRIRRWTVRRGPVTVPAHHLIDPRAGAPARSGLAAVMVRGPKAWCAEGVAKAALVAGPEAGARLLARHHLTGWLLGDDGSVTEVGAGSSTAAGEGPGARTAAATTETVAPRS